MTLAELESLARAATPGPWGRWNRDATRVRRYFGTSGYDDICQASTGENAAYIAALSPERVLAMIAVIEAAKATEQQVSYLLRYRDAERHPELAEALMVLRTALAALEKEQT